MDITDCIYRNRVHCAGSVGPVPGREVLKVGTTITGEGSVVAHRVSRCDLHTVVIAVNGKYPDIELWLEMLIGKDVVLHHYSEKIVANVFTGYLWLFWKETL